MVPQVWALLEECVDAPLEPTEEFVEGAVGQVKVKE